MSEKRQEKYLAIDGGPKTRTIPFPSGSRFGNEELNSIRECLNQNTLFYFKGGKTKEFLKMFCQTVGINHAVATSSGTAAIHCALGSIGLGVGDEVITTSITDMGTVIGILYQNAVPVFCDNLPHTYGMDPTDLEAKITPRTKAIIVVHLTGNPCDMDAIMKIANEHNIAVIEDCAQAWGCFYNNKHVGTLGTTGCFSTNDFKHISTGDGGIVCTNDEQLYRFLHLFSDKGYDRFSDNYFAPEKLSPNYRWSELQAAVGLAQLSKFDKIVQTRQRAGTLLTEMIADCPGVIPPKITARGQSSYWFYMLRINEETLGHSRDHFTECLIAEGIPADKGYIPTPIYKYPLFQNENFFNNGWPVKMLGMTDMDYKHICCPVAESILSTAIVLFLNEFYSEADVEDMAKAIKKVSSFLSSG